MLLTESDPTLKTIISCCKRARHFASETATMDVEHPLYTFWKNSELLLVEDDYSTMIDLLDIRAQRIDKHSVDNMLKGDDTIAAMLFEWQQHLFFDPEAEDDTKK